MNRTPVNGFGVRRIPTVLMAYMASVMRLERTTFGETVRRSDQLSYTPKTEALSRATSQHAFSGCMFANAHGGTLLPAPCFLRAMEEHVTASRRVRCQETPQPIPTEEPLGFVSVGRNLCKEKARALPSGPLHLAVQGPENTAFQSARPRMEPRARAFPWSMPCLEHAFYHIQR